MTFELPAVVTTASELRDLEQNAPNVTPKGIRAALVKAAAELEQYEKAVTDTVAIIEEALRLRISQMDSGSRAQEVERAIKNAMHQAIHRLQRPR